jgi:hypothetical protein
LEIKDLEKFNRALILRWLWFSWDSQDRPWKHLPKVTNKTDMQLFFSSTKISVGDGRNTPFWEARWLDGAALKDLSPNLFNMAHFKMRSVHDELRNNNWISNLQNINSTSLMEEFIQLFMALESVVLNDHKDLISWT